MAAHRSQRVTPECTNPGPDGPGKPPIRSYVRREGRLTPAQYRALSRLWPRYGIDPEAGVISPAEAFGRAAPCLLDIGFGNGEALLEQALAHPENDYIGVEVYRPGIGRLLRRASEHGITNLRVCRVDAMELLRSGLAPSSLGRISVFFPDPWPKKRHHKRRLIRPEFTALAARVLKPGGELWLATDWAQYAEDMLAVLDAAPEFSNLAYAGGFVPAAEGRPVTRFEQRGLKLGHAIHDLRFHRAAE